MLLCSNQLATTCKAHTLLRKEICMRRPILCLPVGLLLPGVEHKEGRLVGPGLDRLSCPLPAPVRLLGAADKPSAAPMPESKLTTRGGGNLMSLHSSTQK